MTTLVEYIHRQLQADPDQNAARLHRQLRSLYGDSFVSVSTVRKVFAALQAGNSWRSLLRGQASRKWQCCRKVLPEVVIEDHQLPEGIERRRAGDQLMPDHHHHQYDDSEPSHEIEPQPDYSDYCPVKSEEDLNALLQLQTGSVLLFDMNMSPTNLLVRSRCPGKLILSGEHATVYGKNAVAITVDLYTEVTVCSAEEEGRVTLTLDSFDFERSWTLEQLQAAVDDSGVRFLTSSPSADGTAAAAPPQFVYDQAKCLGTLGPLLEGKSATGEPPLPTALYNACLAFLLLYLSIGEAAVFAGRKALRVEVTSRLPNGAGLGSSSSYIVALARALFTALNVTAGDDLATLNRWSFEVDKIFHGRPSGIDNSTVTAGGAILFGGGQVQAAIDSAQLAGGLADVPVLLVNTNVGRSTKTMVERCRARLEAFPEVVGPVLESIAALSGNLWEALSTGQLHSLPSLFRMNQSLLECLDVGHEKIDQVVAIAKRHGLAAKLTGAGGGGCVLIYLGNKSDQECEVMSSLQAEGFTTYQVKLGVSGVENF